MWRSHLGFIISGFRTGIVAVAVCLQMLPFFFFLVVVTFAFGVATGGLLVAIPLSFFGFVFAVCWLTAKQVRHHYAPPPADPRPARLPPARPRRARTDDALIKTRDERYQDLKEALMGDRR